MGIPGNIVSVTVKKQHDPFGCQMICGLELDDIEVDLLVIRQIYFAESIWEIVAGHPVNHLRAENQAVLQMI